MLLATDQRLRRGQIEFSPLPVIGETPGQAPKNAPTAFAARCSQVDAGAVIFDVAFELKFVGHPLRNWSI